MHREHVDSVSIHAPARGATELRPTGPGCIDGFNPRPRAGGDTSTRICPVATCRFQSTPPRGGRRPSALSMMRDSHRFQSTPPRGGRPAVVVVRLDAAAVFQSTPPRGGRRAASRTAASLLARFQSTPPRGGRPDARQRSRRLEGFNPRPRAGGDRAMSIRCRWHDPVSIHAPARGATTTSPIAVDDIGMFQSTPPRGGRRRAFVGRRTDGPVSIHAPARGATMAMRDLRSRLGHGFNPRPRAGGDAQRA